MSGKPPDYVADKGEQNGVKGQIVPSGDYCFSAHPLFGFGLTKCLLTYASYLKICKTNMYSSRFESLLGMVKDL